MAAKGPTRRQKACAGRGAFTGERGIVRFDPRTGALYTPTSGSGIERADLAVGAPNPAA
jgi:hypothetical protein